MPPPPFAPVKFSGLIERVSASANRHRFESPTPSPFHASLMPCTLPPAPPGAGAQLVSPDNRDASDRAAADSAGVAAPGTRRAGPRWVQLVLSKSGGLSGGSGGGSLPALDRRRFLLFLNSAGFGAFGPNNPAA